MAEVLLADGSDAHESLCSVIHPLQNIERIGLPHARVSGGRI